MPGIKVTTDDDSATIAWPEFGLDENYTVQQEKKDGTWKTLQAAAEPSETRDYEATINGLNVGKDYTLRIVTAETEALAESATEDAVDTSISGPALGSIARAAGNGSPDVVVSNAFTVVIAAAPSEAGDPLIPVRKYHDLNGNGIPNDGEPGLSGWTIFSDANSNSTLDDGETFTVTVDGGFGSLPLAWGDDYSICEVLQSGWVNTQPGTVCQPFTMPPLSNDNPELPSALVPPFGNVQMIALTKTGDELSKIGDMVDYRIELANTSPEDTPHLTCTILDPMVGVDATISGIPSGDTVAIPVKDFVIPEGAKDPFVNTATVSCSPVGFPNIYTDEASWTTNLFQPAIALTKTGDELSKIGDMVDYRIELANNSSADTPALECTVTDPLVGVNETFTIASGADPKVITVADFVIPVGASDPLVNTATVSCSPHGFPNIYTATADWSTDLLEPPVGPIDKVGGGNAKIAATGANFGTLLPSALLAILAGGLLITLAQRRRIME